MRFFAALLVMIAHWLHFIPGVERLGLGRIGVELFFVISAFLITLQLLHLKEEISRGHLSLMHAAGTFYYRRLLRIIPLYFFVLFCATLFGKGEIRDAFHWNGAFASNFYMIRVQHWPAAFSHFWSLSVEEHFYLAWPFFVLLLNRRLFVIASLLLFVFSFGFRWYIISTSLDYMKAYAHTFSAFDLFSTGALLALWHKSNRIRFERFFMKRWTRMVALTGFAGFFILFYFLDHPFAGICCRAIYGICFFLLVGCLAAGFQGRAGVFLEKKWLVTFGKWSYAVYLVHNFVPGILLGIKALHWPVIAETLIYFIATMCAGALLHSFIEMPIRKFYRQRNLLITRVTS